MKEILEKITAGEDLSFEESKNTMGFLMDGRASPVEIAALLVGLKTKGENPAEIAGAAQAMRERCVKLDVRDKQVIDVCGTGGDNSGTFNISTAVAFVAAAAGVKVAKHGNRSISSRSGSADVLAALGININLKPDRAAQALDEIGLTFLFAPDYHPAMKHVAPVRRELGMKTIFNMLGPLTNPAGTKYQIIGTYSRTAAQAMYEATGMLDMEQVYFVCSGDRFDEIILSEPADVFEYKRSGSSRSYQVDHHTFGFPPVNTTELRGDTPEQNARIMMDLFTRREKNGVFYVTVANAAMALRASGCDDDIKTCVEKAEDAILSGMAHEKVKQLKAFT